MASMAANDCRERAVVAGVDLGTLPRHVAIIMDGNGRWATRQGRDRLEGHAVGYEALQRIVVACGQIGIEYLTVYAFSAENWRRSTSEVEGLMELIERAMREQMNSLAEKRVRTKVIGRMADLPASLREALESGMEKTKDCDGLTFTLAINYGGRTELVDAIRKIHTECEDATSIDEDAVFQRLYLPELPETDLMIRTAGELRWSNFLLWQSAYAELVVTDMLWPEFDENELIQCLLEYQNRTRKFGAVVDNP